MEISVQRVRLSKQFNKNQILSALKNSYKKSMQYICFEFATLIVK